MAHPALVFDLDGTLVDTAPDLLGAMNAVLMQEGRETIDPTTLRHMVGFGARSLIEQAMAATGERILAERLPALVDSFVSHYRERIADESRPFPYVVETLSHFQRRGLAMGVLTNKPHELTVPLLDKLDLTKHFGAIHGAGRYAYVKPDPRVLNHLLDELGAKRDRAVMIGDSATDVATARAAGIPVIVLSYGYTPIPAAELGADAVIDRFSDLPSILNKLVS